MPHVGESTRVRAFAGRAVGFARARPRVQQVTAGGLLLALATAPFGGLRAVAEDPVAPPLVADRPVQVGPFAVEITKAVSLSDLEPSYRPAEGNRVFALVATVTNTSGEPATAHLLAEAVPLPQDAAVIRPEYGNPTIVDYDDGASFSPSDPINPGLSHKVVLLWDQRGDWSGGKATITLDELVWTVDDKYHLYADYWGESGRPAVRGTIDVELKP